MILGIVINVLIYLVARRYFGDFTATLAGVMAIFCGPLIFYDLVVLRSTMTVFFGILLVYLQGLVFDKKKVIWWLLFGSVIGLSLLLQIYYIIFLVMVILLLVVRFRKQTRLLLTYSGCLIAGTIVVMSPAFIRNSIVGAPVFSLNSNGASTFIADNNGTVLNFTGWNANNKIMSDIMGSSGGHILKAIIPTLKTHENPARFLSQLSEKTHALFSWYEIPNNVNFYFFREHSIVLSIAFFNFLLLTPFALVGLILAFMKKKKAVPLYFMIIVQIIPLLGFMVLSRHRVALIPVLIPFAAFTIAELAGSWRGWEKVMIVLGLAILTGLSATPNNEYTIKMAAVDYDSIYNMYYVDSLKKLVDNKEWKAADLLLEDFIEVYEPRVIKNISLTFKCTRIHEAEVYLFFSWIHSIHSQILVPTGDTQGAVNEEHVSARLKDAGNITREMEK
jgi:4-amino-4-deoxy-L-arabinose transferase-like glycosyltransferase